MNAAESGVQAKVTGLNRPTKEDRTALEGKTGLVMRRLNVPWDTGHRARSGSCASRTAKSSCSRTASWPSSATARETPVDMDELKESWGDAPRVPSLPFRRFGAGVGAAPAVLALLVFAIAGVLLIWAGVVRGERIL